MTSRLATIGRHATQLLCLALLALFLFVTDSSASSSHYVHGTNYPEGSDPSHASNPGHHWLRVDPPIAGTVSSGGRYHDGDCVRLAPNTRAASCRSANGGDYSLDIGGTGATFLTVDYGGYAPGFTKHLANSSNISIYSVPTASGNWNSGHAACQWEQYDLYMEWYDDLNNGYHYDHMGWVLFGHQQNWTYSVGHAAISPNMQRPRDDNPYATGTVYYPSFQVATVYPYADSPGGCSGGAHVHLEVFSTHNWGAAYEVHGKGEDYYWYNHVECSDPYLNADCTVGPIDTSAGYPGPQSIYTRPAVGFIGGNTTGAAMW